MYLYIEHPITKEKKLEAQKQYPSLKLVDIKFKPDKLGEGDKVYGDKPATPPKVKTKS